MINTKESDSELTNSSETNNRSNCEIPSFLLDTVVKTNLEMYNSQQTAELNLLNLNVSTMNIYDNTLMESKRHLLRRIPVILGLFTGEGGQMILYHPTSEHPIITPKPPVLYQIAKSVAHSIMAIYQILIPYVSLASKNLIWKSKLNVFLVEIENAIESIPLIHFPDEFKYGREPMQALLEYNKTFIQNCLNKSDYNYDELKSFACNSVTGFIQPLLEIAASVQVQHWCQILDEWKSTILKDQFDQTYAVVNTLYVTRRNNILFTILLQYMGEDAINDRLILIETPEFTTTAEKMLDVLTRIVADRALSKVFFNSYYLMDCEILDTAARNAITKEMKTKGVRPILPHQAAFHSHEIPWNTSQDQRSNFGPAILDAAIVAEDGNQENTTPHLTCPFRRIKKLA